MYSYPLLATLVTIGFACVLAVALHVGLVVVEITPPPGGTLRRAVRYPCRSSLVLAPEAKMLLLAPLHCC